jgi:hypothetical protein
MKNDAVVVYWSPSAFSTDQESWSLLYPEPELVKLKFQNISTGIANGMFACPAVKDNLQNTFAIKSAVDELIDLPVDYLKNTCNLSDREPMPSNNRQIIGLNKIRPTSLNGYSNLEYNLSYVFVANQPLKMEFVAPYLPAKSPSPNAILACGEWDIGKWFRPVNFDYHIPLDNNYFTISSGDELAYVKFATSAKVVLKRFIFNNKLQHLAQEMASSGLRYNNKKSLAHKYAMAKNSKIMDLVLTEVQNNLIKSN